MVNEYSQKGGNASPNTIIPLKIRNVILIFANVVVKISVTLPLRWQRNMPSPFSAGAGHFDRHQSEQQMAF
ncbi:MULTISPECIES: hypothetical protein [unclassified Neglectibacter]|uniref:hypothetical protein n=1 Tax=unclassified Neglectibacter TaxID=2632164 RepID=UPI00136E0418|nr:MULTISPECIES: hypothetical protein [unclassified Neglectibacter]